MVVFNKHFTLWDAPFNFDQWKYYEDSEKVLRMLWQIYWSGNDIPRVIGRILDVHFIVRFTLVYSVNLVGLVICVGK